MEFQKGMDEYSEGTFECGDEYGGCIYQKNGRCCFRVATIQCQIARACHEDQRMIEIDCEHDYALGLL